ncbi:type VII secretion protein EssA [Listeria monocytogenes]|nr:type VII secretion protein EssA [Listeria monocytogenes]ECP2245486.1 type VII secretion protein EssA [Listeria monocytogenes]
MKFKIAALLMLLCFAFAPGVLAADSDSYLENNGKMDIKTDRLQKTEEEKTKELEQMEETELDKNGIPLFTDEMDEKIAKEKAEYDRIKDSLFEEESTSGETVKKTKEKLFTDEYETTAVNTETPTTTETTVEDETKKTKQKTVGGAIAGTLVALAGGIYVAARNVFE